MTHKVGPKGQVVVPKEMRDSLGIKPGMAIDFAVVDGWVQLRPHRSAKGLGGIFKQSGMAQRLLDDRSEERR